MRASAMASKAMGIRGMGFIEDNYLQRGLSWCEVDFEKVVEVPAPDHTCWNYENSDENYLGPCPRPPWCSCVALPLCL